LDLVEEEDQFTHFIGLDDDELQNEEQLDVFRFDPEYEENEQKYQEIKSEILGEDSDDGESSDGEEAEGEEVDEGTLDEDERRQRDLAQLQQEMAIQDKTETNLVGLRRTVYLTIMSSLDHEECCHKLLKMNLKPGQEVCFNLIYAYNVSHITVHRFICVVW
jgi:pre-mRNA-splicing factor CWC22